VFTKVGYNVSWGLLQCTELGDTISSIKWLDELGEKSTMSSDIPWLLHFIDSITATTQSSCSKA
jgi:hypothetical protein